MAPVPPPGPRTSGQPSVPPNGANTGTGNSQQLNPGTGAQQSGPSGSTITTTAAFGGWWDSIWEGVFSAGGLPLLGPLGGGFGWSDIAAGLETAFVAFLKDIFNLIIGPLEITLGVIVWLIAIILIFKDQIAAIGPVAIGALA